MVADGFEMPRVRALSSATEMVEVEAVRDGADDHLVGDSMCEPSSSVEPEESVSFGVRTSDPHPALIRRGLAIDFLPESFHSGASEPAGPVE